jgi:hypothetical protein
MEGLGDHRRTRRICIALCVATLTLAGADGASAHARPGAPADGSAPRVTALAATSRPLCALGWHLRGNRHAGYNCWRGSHKRKPACRPGYQRHRHRRGWVCLPTSTGNPTPQPNAPTKEVPAPTGPTAPPPPPTQSLETYLVNTAFEYAKWWGEKELSESFYTHVYFWKIEPGGCAMVGPQVAECVLLIYKHVEVFSPEEETVVNRWADAIYLLGVFYEYKGPELGYRWRVGQIGDWAKGPWKWL